MNEIHAESHTEYLNFQIDIDNVFTELTTYAGQRYWSIALGPMLVSLLVYRTYVGMFPFGWERT